MRNVVVVRVILKNFISTFIQPIPAMNVSVLVVASFG